LPVNLHVYKILNKGKYLSYGRETALQGGLVMAKSGRLELGDNICVNKDVFRDIIGLSSTTVTYLTTKETEIGEKRKIRANTPSKVIQGHRGLYQSKALTRLLISD